MQCQNHFYLAISKIISLGIGNKFRFSQHLYHELKTFAIVIMSSKEENKE